MAPNDILAVVADKFDEVRARLDEQLALSEIQITRSAHLQQQLDVQRQETAKLRDSIEVANHLLNNLLNKERT